MAFAHIQSVLGSGAVSPASVSVSATGQNNVVVVTIAFSAIRSGISVTDNASTPNTYAQAGTTNDGSISIYQFYGVQVTGGATSITVSWTGGGSVAPIAEEFSGGATSNAAIFDKSSTGTGSAATSGAVTSFAPTNSGELIVSSIIFNAVISSPTAGTNYALGISSSTTKATEYRLNGTTSETAPISWTNSANYDEVAGAYLPAPAAPSPINFIKAPTVMVLR